MTIPENARTVVDVFLDRIDRPGRKTAFLVKKNGNWQEETWADYGEAAREFAQGLLALGVERGDAVAILGDTRREWCICDVGTLIAGAKAVGIYQTLTGEQIRYILDHSDASVLVIQDALFLEKLAPQLTRLPKLRAIVSWEPVEKERAPRPERVFTLEEICEKGRAFARENPDALEARIRSIGPEDTAILVYTSGTTGPPKGAEITHRNIVESAKSNMDVIQVFEHDLSIAFLPMAHVGERVVGHFGRIMTGTAVAFAESLETLLDDIRAVRPTVFGSVPRIFEKVYSAVVAGIDSSPPPRRRIARWCLSVGREWSMLVQQRRPVPLGLRIRRSIADRILFSKLRALFGGRVRFFISGAAPISKEIIEFFHASGMLILEVYGLTECTAVSNANTLEHYRFGSVGREISSCNIRLAEDGEILIKGANVFKGYFKDPVATKEAIVDGWLYSGDVGEIDADGYLRITDRKKDIIVTSGGKNVAPQNIENLLKTDPLISQVMVYGDRRKYLTALITLDPDEARKFIEGKGGAVTADPVKLAEDVLIVKRVEEIVSEKNTQLARYESIKKFRILPRDFSIEDDELTPTLKVKRRNVTRRYREDLESMYEERDRL